MKKLFVAVLAVAALASCAQEDVILNNDKAITFGDAYVQNSTKAIYGDKDADENVIEVEKFQVWGTVTPAGATESVVLYNGANVTRPDGKAYGDAWTCDVQRFWTPNCNYAFYAVVDAAAGAVTAVEDGNPTGVPTSIAYTADGKTDLLYGTANASTNANNVVTGVNTNGAVAFAMQHLLSKVSFKVTNANSSTDYTYNVTSITVSGAYKSSTYDIAAGTWAVGTGEMDDDLSFGSATDIASGNTHTFDKSFVIIPGEPKLNITIEVQTVFNGTAVGTQTYDLTVNTTAEDTDITFVKNTHYNFVVALEGKAIDFTIGSVGDFSTPAGNDVTIQ